MQAVKTPHAELHKSQRSPWLRAAVLGVNDGIVSTASIMLGIIGANLSHKAILTAGVTSLVAGALSMAAGEYVSVSSQRDSERADLDIERRSLEVNPVEELAELTAIYVHRGLDAKLAAQVAAQLHDHDAVAAHARDELGIDQEALSNPTQAAGTSALAFALGSAIPVMATLLTPHQFAGATITIAALIALAISGAIGAYIGGGHRLKAGLRVLVGGGIAMAITFGVGRLF